LGSDGGVSASFLPHVPTAKALASPTPGLMIRPIVRRPCSYYGLVLDRPDPRADLPPPHEHHPGRDALTNRRGVPVARRPRDFLDRDHRRFETRRRRRVLSEGRREGHSRLFRPARSLQAARCVDRARAPFAWSCACRLGRCRSGAHHFGSDEVSERASPQRRSGLRSRRSTTGAIRHLQAGLGRRGAGQPVRQSRSHSGPSTCPEPAPKPHPTLNRYLNSHHQVIEFTGGR
jgi:hypothetical protein